MHYVYILTNPEGRRYTGLTSDLKACLAKHNSGAVPSTSLFLPWTLTAYIALRTRDQAAALERYLKSGSGRAFTTRHFL